MEVIIFMILLLYPLWKSPYYTLERTLGSKSAGLTLQYVTLALTNIIASRLHGIFTGKLKSARQ
jgi:hypothetical protein